MTALTPEQVRHIAKLARLRLTPEEEVRFSTQMTGILDYVTMLQEVDTKGVEATAQVTGTTNAFREDTIRANPTSPDTLLDCSPLPVSDHQIVTPSAHG
jgi:aspartyl-tRNA(Asn)/glutamyl-tRNA(Gln) amidotransferase subunit C